MTDPPAPSLTLRKEDWDNNRWRLFATYGTVSHPSHNISIVFRWTGGPSRSADETSAVERGSATGGTRERTVHGPGTYGAKVQTAAERGGNLCESDWVEKEVDVPGPTPTPTPPPPTPQPTPDTPAWLKGRGDSTQFQIVNDDIVSATISMYISWEQVSGSGRLYRVEQYIGDDQWATTVADITGTAIIASGMQPESTYIFRVRAGWEGGPGVGRLSSGWRQGTVETPTPFDGHQADHTVQYRVDTPPIGAHMPDFSVGISEAVREWNDAAGDGFLICAAGECEDENTGVKKNTDGKTIVVKFPSGAKKSVHNPSDLPGYEDCKNSYACVVTRPSDWPSDRHVPNQELRIEEPAWEAEGGSKYSPPDHHRLVWTNDFALHDIEVLDEELDAKYVYFRWALMHEFGHAYGLTDLYDLPEGNYSGYLMFEDEERAVQSVPRSDVDYLHGVYRNHTAH